MTHDNAYVRTDDERRADWTKVYRLEPDWVPVVARLVQLEDERVHHLSRLMRQADTISRLRSDLKQATSGTGEDALT